MEQTDKFITVSGGSDTPGAGVDDWAAAGSSVAGAQRPVTTSTSSTAERPSPGWTPWARDSEGKASGKADIIGKEVRPKQIGEDSAQSGNESAQNAPNIKEPRITSIEVVKRAYKPGPKSKKRKIGKSFMKVNASRGSPPPLIPNRSEEESTCTNSCMSSDENEAKSYRSADSDSSCMSGMTNITTASGATKRTRGSFRQSERGNTSHKDSIRMSSSEEDEQTPLMERLPNNDLPTLERKKRGRPPTTGKGVCSREIRSRQQELKRLDAQLEIARNIERGQFEPGSHRNKTEVRYIEKTEEHMQNLPIRDIVAEMIETAKKIHGVATRSSNLKGTFTKILKESAMKIEVGSDILACRVMPREGKEERETELLRDRVQQLEKELMELKESRDREVMPPPPPAKSTRNQIPLYRHDQMNVDDDNIIDERLDDPSPTSRIISPLKEEWPPVLRPPIQGQQRVLEDATRERITSIPVSAPERRKKTKEKKSLEEQFSEFMSIMKEKMETMFLEFMKTRYFPENPVTGARYKADTPTTRDGVMSARPVPSRTQGKKGSSRRRTLSRDSSKARSVTRDGKQKSVQTSINASSQPIINKSTETWSQVVNRKVKRVANKVEQNQQGPVLSQKSPKTQSVQIKEKTKPFKRRPPRTAAVVLTCPKGKYAETMAEIRGKMKLSEVGIQDGIKTRTAATGALILEVPGAENAPKADALAAGIKNILQNREGFKVDRPIMTAEVRIKDLEESITNEEIQKAVAEKGKCRVFEVQVGTIRRTPRGQGTVWLRLPLVAAKKAAVDGRIKVGWSKVRIELLEARPLRCYRCFERGHVRERCQSAMDRSGLCYRCGGSGHTSRDCAATPKCPLCTSIGRPADHILGAKQCAPRVRKQPKKDGGRGTDVMLTSVPSTSAEPALAYGDERGNKQSQEVLLPQRKSTGRQKTRSPEGATIENMEVDAPEEGGTPQS